MRNNEIVSWIKANPAKSALILLAIGIMFYIIDSSISSANRAKNLITSHASKIDREGGKLKAEVSARIDGVQKAFKEIDAITERFKFDKKLRNENDSFRETQSGNARYESKRQEIFSVLSHNENMLKNLKAKIGANSENHKKNYIDLPEYRRLIVTIYENIAHIFDVNKSLAYFEHCDYFESNFNGAASCVINSSEYHHYNHPLARKQEIENLVKKLGDIYLTTSADERANKTQVIYNDIKKTYFTEVEEDWGVRWARSYGDYAAKALLPYKAFIEEIINAQRQIDVKEAQEYLKENAWSRCITWYNKISINKIKDKTRTFKRASELANNFPWKEKDISTSNSEDHDFRACEDEINATGLDSGKSSVTPYNLLENQTSVRVLLRLMETNKDFGVKDDE